MTKYAFGPGGCVGALLLMAACAAEPAATSPPPAEAPAAAEAAATPRLTVSTPEPGVVLEPLEVVTPTATYRFQVEIADDEPERQRGLMHRERMAEDRGMLFLFPGPPRPQGFWMKNTLIPLDIIYLQPDGRILSIARRTTPLSEAPIPSNGPASAVLEINGGLSDRLGIAPGDQIRHRAFPNG
jgi:uncharacterized protein